MGELKNLWNEEGKRLPRKKIELDLYRTQKEIVQEPENQSLIILSINSAHRVKLSNRLDFPASN